MKFELSRACFFLLAFASTYARGSLTDVPPQKNIASAEDLPPPPTSLGPDDDTSRSLRIVGGSDAAPGEFPYFIQLGGCAASLIAPRVALSAAHCRMWRKQGKNIKVGAARKNGDDKTWSSAQRARDIKVVATAEHPDFNKTSSPFLNYDYGLMLLEEDYIMDSDITLKLNLDDDFPPNDMDMYVIGLGATVYGQRGHAFPEVLQKVEVPAMLNNECHSKWDDISNQQICAGDWYGSNNPNGKDACQGDSGAPLVLVSSEDNVHTQIGIVSWGVNCARYPGVYARVSQGMAWIKDQVCNIWEVENHNGICPTPEPTSVPTKEPSASPTPEPTSVPTTEPSASPTEEVTDMTESPTTPPTDRPTLGVGGAGDCVDSTSFRHKGKNNRPCSWLSKKKQCGQRAFKKKTHPNDKTKVRDHCKRSCHNLGSLKACPVIGT